MATAKKTFSRAKPAANVVTTAAGKFTDPEVIQELRLQELTNKGYTPLKLDHTKYQVQQKLDTESLLSAIDGEAEAIINKQSLATIMMVRYHFSCDDPKESALVNWFEVKDAKVRKSLWLQLCAECFLIGTLSEDGKSLALDDNRHTDADKKLKAAATQVLPFAYRVAKYGNIGEIALNASGLLIVKGRHFYKTSSKPDAELLDNWVILSGKSTNGHSSVAQAIKNARDELGQGKSGASESVSFQNAVTTIAARLPSFKSYAALPKVARAPLDRTLKELLRLYDLASLLDELVKLDASKLADGAFKNALISYKEHVARQTGKAKGNLGDDDE